VEEETKDKEINQLGEQFEVKTPPLLLTFPFPLHDTCSDNQYGNLLRSI